MDQEELNAKLKVINSTVKQLKKLMIAFIVALHGEEEDIQASLEYEVIKDINKILYKIAPQQFIARYDIVPKKVVE